jgi:hypothetical protein
MPAIDAALTFDLLSGQQTTVGKTKNRYRF